MKHRSKQLVISVSERIGSVSAVVTQPDAPVAVLILAHGAGAGMKHPFMERLAQLLADYAVATLRFNFPFSEAGKKRPDVPAVAQKTISAAIEKAISLFPDLPLFAGGKSFGGRMTSQLMAHEPVADVLGLVFFGFPLHAPGKPSVERAAHLHEVDVPMLFLQGTRDALADIHLVKSVLHQLPGSTLQVMEGADHGFRSGKTDFLPALAENAYRWMVSTTAKKRARMRKK